MSKIKITAYIDTDDYEDGAEELDPNDPSGLSAVGHEELMRSMVGDLDDVRVEAEK